MIFGNKIFKNKIKNILAFNTDEFKEAFKELELLRKNSYLLGYIRYEAKDIFLGKELTSSLPLLYFEAFESHEEYIPSLTKNYALEPSCRLDYKAYEAKIQAIKEQIQKGNTYEVNFTCDFDVDFQGNDFNLFESLIQKQHTPYCAYIKNEYDTVLSFSPELFFSIDCHNHIVTKPMKGTVKRNQNAGNDAQLKDFLRNDEKNKAENAMIVDLLRNDLSKIAKKCSVCVPKLFEVETYPTLFQMISQVDADLKENTSLYEIFDALFPCGSITGAPKISTMQIIEEVEVGKRDIYCGAIGLISPEEMIFSVPIRILQKSRDEETFRYRSGGAIVWDSKAQEEWEEIFTKASFLKNTFNILETLKIENGVALFLQEHISRMAKTAEFFKYPFDPAQVVLQYGTDCMARILLNKKGEINIEYKPLVESKTSKVKISTTKVFSNNYFLRYKTDFRPHFNTVDYTKYFDEIYLNEKGELTEGSRTNIILQLDGKLYTPPLSSGLLNGIYRQKLLDEKQCIEKILSLDDWHKAEKIFCVNSVRGMKEVERV